MITAGVAILKWIINMTGRLVKKISLGLFEPPEHFGPNSLPIRPLTAGLK